MSPPQIVAFDSGHLLERGTDVALFDYADFNETLLGNRSLILCPASADIQCLDKFRARFPVLLYQGPQDLVHLLQGVDLYYKIVSGERPPEWSREAPEPVRPVGGRVGIHCVFRADQPHGDVYAAVSAWVARHRSNGNDVPYVPHMVHLPEAEGDLRAELRIPQAATVLGRHGGLDTFNIPFAQEVVRAALPQREDLWPMARSRIGFAQRPGTAVLPTCSTATTRSSTAARMACCAEAPARTQSGS